MNAVLGAWLVEVGIIGVRDLTSAKRLPLPSELLSTFVVFGALSALAGTNTGRQPATAVAWGLVVATFLSSKVDFLKPVGDFLAPTSPPLTYGPTGGQYTPPTAAVVLKHQGRS